MVSDILGKSREQALRRLISDLKDGKVDSEISDWLYNFNLKREDVYTSSSCSGRVTVMYGNELFSKADSRMVCSCHYPENCRKYLCQYAAEVSSLIGKGSFKSWVSLQPPIIHFITTNTDVVKRIVSCAVSSGFVHSCYRETKKGYVVEVRAYDKLHVILPTSCENLLLLCEMLEKYKVRLKKFLNCIDNSFSKSF